MSGEFIVECSICGQPWEVADPLYSAPGAWIVVPDHPMLGQDGAVTAVPCLGPQAPAFGTGPRSEWESAWELRHPGRPKPGVLEGRGVRYLGPR